MLGVNVLGVKIVKKVKPSTSRLKTRFENSFVLKKSQNRPCVNRVIKDWLGKKF